MTLPIIKNNNKVPAVIFVHGSGPADMDESIGALKPFKDLAVNFAFQGIASIRYDKRTFTYQSTLKNDYDFTIYDEYVYDAISAFNILKNDSRIDPNNTYIIGHSQGASVTPLILNEVEGIKGGILLAGSTSHILDILLEQVKAQSEDTYNQYLPMVTTVKSINEVSDNLKSRAFFGAYYPYWGNYNNINFEEETKQAASKHSLLIMQGGADLQISKKHFDKYKEILSGYSSVSYKFYENLNHCFVDGTNETINNAYSIQKDIPSEVINDIVSWVENQK